MKPNPITNDAQAKTAAEYADYLAAEIRAEDADDESRDLMLNRMMEIATDLADYYEAAAKVEPIAKLVVHNRGLVLSTAHRATLRLVANTNTVNGES